MKQESSLDKTLIAKAVISKIRKEGNPESIRAKYVNDFEPPNMIHLKGSDESYAPDIAAEYKKTMDVYEIELNSEMPVTKWRLFSLYARKNNGNFYLVVPDYLKEEVKHQLLNREINAGLIYFDTRN